MASKMMQNGPYEVMDEHENCLMQSYLSLQSQLSPPYQLPSQSPVHLAQLNQALLYGMLTQPQISQSFVTHLAAVTSDGYTSFVSILLRLVNESYPKLLDQSRAQLLWLLRQLIELSASDVDTLCLSLLRRIVGGDLTQGNVWLASQLLDILRSNWGWLTGNPGVLTNALFTYLRILPDHHYMVKSALNELRQNEIAFCVQVLRDCFQDCLVIGRDLVRLLQDVACIPEFESIWRDLLSNPTAFKTPLFADIAQLYVVRTPTRYLASRLTPEMESQIRFMLTHVRWGSQRRYQTWFAQRFLSAPESETLVCDLIRFICCVHHPTNQILQSDIVSRWAIVGWLIKCCKSHHVEANAKLALFYDWLFFMSKTDNIMNIEPAILLMVHSIPKYIDMTHSLLEFLFFLIDHYDPSRRDLVHRGVVASMDILVGKGVVRSLEPLSASNLVVPWLKEKLITYFPAHCKSNQCDAVKTVKHELLQQESFSVVPNSHVAGIMKAVVPATQVHPGTSVADPSPFVGSNSQGVETVGMNNHELKTSEVAANAICHKRRRIDIATMEDLVAALAKSQEAAVTVLEKLLISFLYGQDHPPSDRHRDLVKGGDISYDSMTKSFVESIEKFVRQVTDILKSGGYDLFSSLTGNSSTILESDEIMSPTSVILRLYVESQHPQMMQMLLFWHSENFAIGPRLLNYACRLAEGLEQSINAPPHMLVVRETDSLSETMKRCCVKPDGEPGAHLHDPGSNNHERGCHLKSNGETRAVKKVSFEGASPLVWHMSFQTDCIQGMWKEGKKQDPEVATDVQACYRSAVTSAFGAYEQYMREVRRKALATHYQSVQYRILHKDRLENGVAKVENRDAEDEGLELALLADLEMCLIWNVHRLLTVFPWVFKYLAKSCTGKEEIIRFLVSVLNPAELSRFELKLSLREISVVGAEPDSVAGLIRNSLQWDCFEQQYFWRLLLADLQFVAAPFAIELVKCCTSFLLPSLHPEAMSGLLLYLKLQRPTVQFVLTIMFLPKDFGKLAAAVLASWVVSDVLTVFESLNVLIQQNVKNGQERSEGSEHSASLSNKLNTFAVSVLFKFFENYMAKSTAEDDKMKGTSSQIKHALLELANICSPNGMVYAQNC